MKKKDIIFFVGIIMMLLGIFILFRLELAPLSSVEIGPIKASNLSERSATHIISGVLLIIFGFIISFGQQGLKHLTKFFS
ncbi:MAG: hypothetical protein AABX65_00545 [Nanoarchaeota archaeon]